MKVIRAEESPEIIPFEPIDAYAIIYFENAASLKRKRIMFLRFSRPRQVYGLAWEVDSVDIVNYSGKKGSLVME